MKIFFLIALTAGLFQSARAEDGFVPLFNGENLDGWKNVNCAPETWSVKDGMIHCTGKPIGALRTTRQYENFILELEWRHLKPGGNAGVFIWASPISAKGQPFLRAIEVQVLDHAYGKSDWFTTHGDVFPIHGSTMRPHGRHNGMRSFPSEERSNPSPEWNKYRIECNNGVLRLHVNGKEVSGGNECNWRKGYLALESESSPVDFRNIRIKELPTSGATKEMSAPEWSGHESLYSGVDLAGWSTEDSGWKSNDWRLVHKKTKSNAEPIWCGAKVKGGVLSFDWKLPKGSKDKLRVVSKGTDKPILEIGSGDGKWQRSEVKLPATDSPIGFEIAGEAELAGIYIQLEK